jgi:hypothetical protein
VNELPPTPPDDESPPPGETEPEGDGMYPPVQQVRQKLIGARLTDPVAPGAFATGVMILKGREEFVLDFVQAVRPPHRVSARVVMSPRTMGEFIEALENNLEKYNERFGEPKGPPPRKSDAPRPPVEQFYENLKLPDEKLSGAYANIVMIGHTPGEFLLDFATQFYPRPSVSARVYVSSGNVPNMLRALKQSYRHHQQGPDRQKDSDGGCESESDE